MSYQITFESKSSEDNSDEKSIYPSTPPNSPVKKPKSDVIYVIYDNNSPVCFSMTREKSKRIINDLVQNVYNKMNPFELSNIRLDRGNEFEVNLIMKCNAYIFSYDKKIHNFKCVPVSHFSCLHKKD